MFLVGLSMGPVHHYYYSYLNYILPKRDMGSITKKILLDQFVMSPICIAQFFYTIGLIERKSVQECTQELKDKFYHTYTVNLVVFFRGI